MTVDFLRDLLNMREPDRNSLIPALMNTVGDLTFRDVVKLINTINDDIKDSEQTRNNSLERITRYTNSLKRNTKRNKYGEFFPSVIPNQLVFVNFAGISAELDFPHYAIVWDTDSYQETVQVIPTTSYKEGVTEESSTFFNIGKISFMNVETVVKLDHIMSISRKRIIKSQLKNPATGTDEPVVISQAQIQRIQEGFHCMGNRLPSLYHFILNNNRASLPELQDPVQYEQLHRPFIRVQPSEVDVFSYTLLSDPLTVYNINWKRHALTGEKRRKLLDSWSKAKAILDETNPTNIIKTKDQSILDSYNSIQSEYAV